MTHPNEDFIILKDIMDFSNCIYHFHPYKHCIMSFFRNQTHPRTDFHPNKDLFLPKEESWLDCKMKEINVIISICCCIVVSNECILSVIVKLLISLVASELSVHSSQAFPFFRSLDFLAMS